MLGKPFAPRFMPRQPRSRPRKSKPCKVESPPAGANLQRMALSCRYEGSSRHRPSGISAADREAGRTLEGLSRRHPDKSVCPPELANDHVRVEAMLRQAVEAGHAGDWGQDSPYYPAKVWYKDTHTGIIYMARENSPRSGKYHGYPLQLGEEVQGLP